jgi:monoterpene epsilon-lactone hydrolase
MSFAMLTFAESPKARCQTPATSTPVQPPLPNTISPEARAALAPLLAQPAPNAEVSVPNMRAFTAMVQDQVSKLQLKRYNVRIEEGIMAGVPVRIFTPSGMPEANKSRVLLDLPGGGFIVDSGSLTENIPIAALTKTKVIAVLYRLAPEHPFPAAVDDAVAVYRDLLKTYKPSSIVLYGTSAGAILSAETIVALRAAIVPLPAAVGFFSGTADFSTDGDSSQFSPKINGKTLRESVAGYVGKTDPKNPSLSPLFANLAGFPPTLCITGTRDLLLSQTSRFDLALLNAGVDTQLVVFEAMPHAHWSYLDIPESTQAFEIMSRFFELELHEPHQGWIETRP